MAEKIKTGDTFYKEVFVTTKDAYGDEIPVDLSPYDDNYFVIKRSAEDSDEDAFVFKQIGIKGDPADGVLSINLTPQETNNFPISTSEEPYLQGYVQIGSTTTGEVHEVASFKIKVVKGGVWHITEITP